jgi:hypothetical protein
MNMYKCASTAATWQHSTSQHETSAGRQQKGRGLRQRQPCELWAAVAVWPQAPGPGGSRASRHASARVSETSTQHAAGGGERGDRASRRKAAVRDGVHARARHRRPSRKPPTVPSATARPPPPVTCVSCRARTCSVLRADRARAHVLSSVRRANGGLSGWLR